MATKSHSSRASHAAASHEDSTLDELKGLLAEAEKALSSGIDHGSDEATALRTKLKDALAQGKNTVRHAYDYAKEQAAHADEAIHTHPYVAIGIAAAVGVLAGVLIGRNNNR